MTNVKSAPLFTFPKDKPVELTGLVRGPDGAPYVLDTAGKTVWRIDLAKKQATPILQLGPAGVGHPRRRPQVPDHSAARTC